MCIERFLHPHSQVASYPDWLCCFEVLTACLLPHWDYQGPPSPQQPLPWKPAPQRNDPFEYQCVDPLCSSTSVCSKSLENSIHIFSVLSSPSCSLPLFFFSFPHRLFLSTWESPDWHTTFDPTAHCTR